MKFKLDGITLHLGRLRRDGTRNVERASLSDWRSVLPKLRKKKIKAKMAGDRLYLRLADDHQLKLCFWEAG